MTLSRLSPEDRVLLRSDRDPRSRVTVGGLALLSGRPDWALLRERMDRATRTIPALRARVVEPSLSTTEPRWVVDPDFVIDRHIRHVALPTPGGRDQLVELAERFVAEPFDTSGPLWRMLCVDGVDKGAAVLVALSPIVRDADLPLDLLAIAVDTAADGPDLPPIPVPTDLEPADLAKEGVRELPWRAVELAISGVHEVGSLALHAATDLQGAMDRVAGLVTPPAAVQGSALMAGRGTERALVLRSFPASRVDGAERHRGGQRLHIAAIREALLAYHAELGLPLTSLGITAASNPAYLRRALAPAQDPVDALGRLLPLLPSGVVDALAKPSRGSDVAVSHLDVVPGSVGAAKVTEWYAVGPVPGNAVTSVAVSTGSDLHVAIRFDPESIRDRAVFERCLDAAFEDLLGPASASQKPAAARKSAAKKAAAKKAPAKKATAKSTSPSTRKRAGS